MLHILRLRVAVRFLEIYPRDGAQPFFKSACARFDKAKKMQFLVKDQKLDNAQQEVAKGPGLLTKQCIKHPVTFFFIMLSFSV